jgi:hypothetical protein
MNFQWAGLLLAATTFGTIAIGHILVHRLHPKLGTRPGAGKEQSHLWCPGHRRHNHSLGWYRVLPAGKTRPEWASVGVNRLCK